MILEVSFSPFVTLRLFKCLFLEGMRQPTENGTRWSELIDMLKCVVALG